MAPFLYEKFAILPATDSGVTPDDLKTVDDLSRKWPVIEKAEMAADALANPLTAPIAVARKFPTHTSGRNLGVTEAAWIWSEFRQ